MSDSKTMYRARAALTTASNPLVLQKYLSEIHCNMETHRTKQFMRMQIRIGPERQWQGVMIFAAIISLKVLQPPYCSEPLSQEKILQPLAILKAQLARAHAHAGTIPTPNTPLDKHQSADVQCGRCKASSICLACNYCICCWIGCEAWAAKALR